MLEEKAESREGSWRSGALLCLPSTLISHSGTLPQRDKLEQLLMLGSGCRGMGVTADSLKPSLCSAISRTCPQGRIYPSISSNTVSPTTMLVPWLTVSSEKGESFAAVLRWPSEVLVQGITLPNTVRLNICDAMAAGDFY